MEDYNAEIIIENKQQSEEGDEVFNVNVPCKLMKKDNKVYIFYKDEGISSKIKCDEGVVTVTRMGKFSNEMIYKQGELTEFLYKMPYGTTKMQIMSHKVKYSFNENSVDIELVYDLLFSGGENKNSMKISVFEGMEGEN